MEQVIERVDKSKYLDYRSVDPEMAKQEALKVAKGIQSDILDDYRGHLREGGVIAATRSHREYLLRVSAFIRDAEDGDDWKGLGEALVETGTFMLVGDLNKKSDVRNNFRDIVDALKYVGLGLAVLEK